MAEPKMRRLSCKELPEGYALQVLDIDSLHEISLISDNSEEPVRTWTILSAPSARTKDFAMSLRIARHEAIALAHTDVVAGLKDTRAAIKTLSDAIARADNLDTEEAVEQAEEIAREFLQRRKESDPCA